MSTKKWLPPNPSIAPVRLVVDLPGTTEDGAASISGLGPKNDSLIVAGARQELPAVAPTDRVDAGEVIVHLRERKIDYDSEMRERRISILTQQRLENGFICTWQSILGTFESFWSLGLRMGARFQTVTLSIVYEMITFHLLINL